MCGITGYVGSGAAVPTSLINLKRLEYRGYDSAGIAFPNSTRIQVVRAIGKIANLERALPANAQDAKDAQNAKVAIAHTRWATHGRPSEANAHPHTDCSGRIAVVHNGIIENYAELRNALIAQGHTFQSETDTEVLSHLIEQQLTESHPSSNKLNELYEQNKNRSEADISRAIRQALAQVTGSYALAVIAQDTPQTVYVARKDSPLVIGLGEGENFLASDIPAVMRYTRRVILLEDGDFALLTPQTVTILDTHGNSVNRSPLEVTWDDTAAEKGGYAHFMLKEIHEGPSTVRATLRGRLRRDGTVQLGAESEVVLPIASPGNDHAFSKIAIVGCGTAYHAGVVGKRLFEQLLRRPVEVSVASEFRYSDPLVDPETLVILISQSGETADTLAAMREAKAKGAQTLAVVNVVGSTLAREADATLLTQAGPEIGVASTKAYLAQLTALSLLALALAGPEPEFSYELQRLPDLIAQCLEQEKEIAALAERLAAHSSFFFLGRGYDHAVALEAALKLKEISYLHAEAYPAGEMKHGPLALVEPGVAVVGLCTQPSTNEKMVSNLKEVKAREGTVVAVVRAGDTVPDCADAVIRVPVTHASLMPIVTMVPMQLLAYYVALARGCSIDQPRNLAKSVTVE